MSKVTSKRQVTIPKSVADQYGIQPGSTVVFEPAGEVIRLKLETGSDVLDPLDSEARLELFDAATERQTEREARVRPTLAEEPTGRGWTREELYDRGIPR